MIVIFLFLLPFLQIGLSYYVSVQTLSALLITIFLAPYISKNSFIMFLFLCIVAALMMISVFSISGATGEDVLRRGREVLFFILTTLTVRGYTNYAPFTVTPRTHMPIVIVSLGLTVLALFQYVALRTGSYFGIPKALYVTNSETLPDLLDLMYGKLRPFGTFGEPSYFSFVLLSLFVMLSPLVRFRFQKQRDVKALGSGELAWLHPASSAAILGSLAIMIAGVVGQSLSFYLAFPILLYACVVRFLSSQIQFRFAVGVSTAVAILLASSLASAVLSRVDSGTQGEVDVSTSARLIKPVQIIPQFLKEHPFGSPLSKWIEAISPISSQYGVPAHEVGHNALFNSFFNYGITGFACLLLTVFAPKSNAMKVYVGLTFMFNGSIYSMDKYFVIVLTVAIYISYQRFTSLDPQGLPSATRQRRFDRTHTFGGRR